jgi:prepilin-type N-terminal cleavage/methylation domain-containing protein/prepilin-type processing-associated H-X9-DG protein
MGDHACHSDRIRRPAGILPRTARARAESGRRSALTLLELLVVIAIASVLIAILIPSLRGARDQARSVACRSNLRQLMHGMLLYATDDGALPGTHTLFHMQRLFGAEWPRPAGVTWDGARDRIVDFNVTAPYEKPYDRDPEFRAHVPRRGTLFPYVQSENTYRCPADRPGPVDDSPRGGGGNGRLSYALNGYVGYQPPERLGQFTYVAPAPNNPLPNTDATRSFDTGQRVIFAPARFMTMFEEHPKYHLNAAFPDGNFNGLDRVATRHQATGSAQAQTSRPSIAFLDGHVAAPLLPAGTDGRKLFASFGQPFFWRANGPPDQLNVAAFIKNLPGNCPWPRPE